MEILSIFGNHGRIQSASWYLARFFPWRRPLAATVIFFAPVSGEGIYFLAAGRAIFLAAGEIQLGRKAYVY